MTDLFGLILDFLASRLKSRATLEAEILVLRQQINVLRRRAPKRPHLNNTDRFLFVWLYRWFPSILGAIAIVRPETIIRWHRAGFRVYCIGAGGRATVLADRRSRLSSVRSLARSVAPTISGARHAFMVSFSSSASRSLSRQSLGICAASRGHHLKAGARF